MCRAQREPLECYEDGRRRHLLSEGVAASPDAVASDPSRNKLCASERIDCAESRLMRDAEFPFVVTEDKEIIARFKRLKDAAKFASYHEWGDFHHNVAVSKIPIAFVQQESRTKP